MRLCIISKLVNGNSVIAACVTRYGPPRDETANIKYNISSISIRNIRKIKQK